MEDQEALWMKLVRERGTGLGILYIVRPHMVALVSGRHRLREPVCPALLSWRVT